MPRIRLPVISEPEEGTRTVIESPPGSDPIIRGAGDTDLLCGQCELILAEAISQNTLQNIVLHCRGCGAYNNIA